MSNRGWVPTPFVMFQYTLIAAVISAVLLTPSHRVRKAREMGCYVEGMSKAEIMDCIRDDEVGVQMNFAK